MPLKTISIEDDPQIGKKIGGLKIVSVEDEPAPQPDRAHVINLTAPDQSTFGGRTASRVNEAEQYNQGPVFNALRKGAVGVETLGDMAMTAAKKLTPAPIKEGIKGGLNYLNNQQPRVATGESSHLAGETGLNQPLETPQDTKPLLQAGVSALSKFDAMAKNSKLGPEYQAGKDALTIGTAGPVEGLGIEAGAKLGGKVLNKVGKTAEALSNRVENTTIKIMAPEQKMGAKPEYFSKYELFGSPKAVKEKAHQQIAELGTQLKEKINSVEFKKDDPATRINLAQLLNRVEEKLVKDNKFNPLDMKRAVKNIKDNLVEGHDLNLKKAPAISNNIDLADAQELKRFIGKSGDWLEHNGKIMANQEATNSAKVYNTIYDELKTELENKGPEGIKELNKAMSELIPMERAASKRLLVTSRKNPISLDDYIGGLAVAGSTFSGNLKPLAVVIANIASKSPLTAKGLNYTGKKLQDFGKSFTDMTPLEKPISDIPTINKELLKPELSKLSKSAKDMLKNNRGTVGAVNPQVHTENFKQWFGDWEKAPEQASKVVDKEGKPLVVFHGSRKAFDSFDVNKAGDNNKFIKKGQYFTDNPKEADFYTEKMDNDYNTRKGNSPNIKSVLLDIKNPLVIESGGNATNYFDRNMDALFKKAEKENRDGFIIKGNDENGNIYVTINPNQIKSATGNSGAFSSATNDIRGNSGVKTMAGIAGAGAGLSALAAMARNRNKERK